MSIRYKVLKLIKEADDSDKILTTIRVSPEEFEEIKKEPTGVFLNNKLTYFGLTIKK